MTQIKFKRIDNYYGKFYIEDVKNLEYNKSVYISKDIVYLLKHTYIFNVIRRYVFEHLGQDLYEDSDWRANQIHYFY